MPVYVVRRTEPVLVSVTVEATSPADARLAALEVWKADASNAAALAEPERQPSALDDTGDERSTARYEENEDDARDERMREHRMGLGGSQSPREETEA